MDIISEDVLNCSNVTVDQGKIAALTRGVTGIVCCVLCLLALLFQVISICRLRNSNTLQRLFLYLTISTVFYMGALSLHLEHYFQYEGQERMCVIISVLDQYTGSIQLLITLGITVVLFHKLFSLCEAYKNFMSTCKPSSQLVQRYCYEVGLCVTSALLPWTMIWIPFLSQQGSRYGQSGPWCWIQNKDPITCDEIPYSIFEQVLLWYAPFGLIAFISLLCIICQLVFFCYLRFHRGLLEKQTKTVIKEMLLLLTFLMMFCTVWLVEGVIYFISIANVPQLDTFTLWMVYAIITPIGGIVVPIGFFAYLFYSKCSSSSSRHYIDIGDYSNLQTGKDAERFIHNPSRVSAASRTSDRDSNQFLDRSDEFTTSDQETKPLLGSTSKSKYSTVN